MKSGQELDGGDFLLCQLRLYWNYVSLNVLLVWSQVMVDHKRNL